MAEIILGITKGLFRYDLTDYFAILGIPIGADTSKIRERYVKIAYRLHPDTCKEKTPEQKQQASKILSRVVNPSYEKLSKESSLSEYLIVLSQTGRSMITEASASAVEGKAAQKLFGFHQDLDLAYFKFLSVLVNHQYEDLDLNRIYNAIAEISELNLVYLFRKQGEGIRQYRSCPIPQVEKTTLTQAPSPPSRESVCDQAKTSSPLETCIRRAQEYLEKENYAQIILEMRDALKIDPKNGRCHGLMGLAYLRQNQLPMAKVYVDTALKADPDDVVVRQARDEYRKLAPHVEASKRKPEDSSKKTGFWGTMFGDKSK